MDTKYATPKRESLEHSEDLEDNDDSTVGDRKLGSIVSESASPSSTSKFPVEKSCEINSLSSQDVIVKKEPMEVSQDSEVIEKSSETNRSSDLSSTDFVPKKTSHEKIEITEIVLMNNSGSTSVKVTNPINLSTSTSSIQDLSPYQLFLGSWKNHSVHSSLLDDNPKRLKCLKCEFYTSSGTFLKEHYKCKHLVELFPCNECSILFVSKDNLIKHTRIRHRLNKQWKCLRCDFSTKQYCNLVRHRKKHSKLLQCVDCDRNFPSRQQLQGHMLKFHAEKVDASNTHQCNICNSVFARRSRLEKHMHKHFGIRPYSCNLCDYKSTFRKNVYRHQITRHFFPTTLRCSICPKRFYDKKLLDEHEISHLVHQCYLCSFKASSWKSLARHCHKTHGKKAVKPLQCEICLVRFSLEVSLEKHTCKKCSKCLKTFPRKWNLDRHLTGTCQIEKSDKKCKPNADEKTHPDPVCLKCHACHEQFTKYKVLKRHLEFCVFKS